MGKVVTIEVVIDAAMCRELWSLEGDETSSAEFTLLLPSRLQQQRRESFSKGKYNFYFIF